MSLTADQHRALAAVAAGDSSKLWPSMRKALLRRKLIVAAEDRPTPCDERRARPPVWRFAVTEAGMAALASFSPGVAPARSESIARKPQIVRRSQP